MKIGATISPALLSLLEAKRLAVDYIEVNGEHRMETLERALALRPVLLHDISYRFWLNYEDPFDEPTMTKARTMLDKANPPWHSTGIGASAEPQAHTTEFWRGAPPGALQTRERCLENIVRNGKRLHEWVGRPLLLENFNYHPTDAYEYICESDTFNQLVKAIGCDMLLDLAHAQISARNMKLGDPRGYIEKFPLETVYEIHINRPFDDGVQMLDRHGPIGERDLDLLRWTMARTPKLEAITLESHEPSEEALTEELRLIRTVVQ